jgi:hypothetical protein
VVATSANGCTANGNVTVTVDQLPTVTVANPVITICDGSSAILGVSANNFNSIQWSPATNLVGANTTTPTANPTTTTIYNVVATSANGCTANGNVTVIVNPMPVVTVANSNISVCAGQSAQLSAMVSSGSISWSPSTGLSSTTSATPTANPMTTTTYQIVASANGCMDSKTITVTVNPLPVVAANDIAICQGNGMMVNANSSIAGSNWSWSPSIGLSTISSNSPFASPTATTTYAVMATSPAGCVGVKSVTVTVNSKPTVSFTYADSSKYIKFSNLSTNATHYKWDFGDGNYSTRLNPTHPYKLNGSFNVWLTAYNGCDSVMVNKMITGVKAVDTTKTATEEIVSNSCVFVFNDNDKNNLTINNVYGVSLIEIYNNSCHIVATKKTNGAQQVVFDLSDLFGGIYFIRFTTIGGEFFTKKIVKH